MGWGSKRAVAVVGALALLGMGTLAGQVPARAVVGLAPPSPNFSIGDPSEATVGGTGCNANTVSEPIVKVTPDDTVILASEGGLGTGTELWRQTQAVGGSGASACGLSYVGQPNVIAPGAGLSGGDVDVAVASAPLASGLHRVYVVSTGGSAITLSHSEDDGATWSNAIQAPNLVDFDDRPFITAWGAATAIAVVHGMSQETVMRTDDGGVTWHQISATPGGGEFGFIAADRHSTDGVVGAPDGQAGFYVYQASAGGIAVSKDGGFTWQLRVPPCGYPQANQFPIVSVAPDGTAWVAWSTGSDIRVAFSRSHGGKWTCNTTRIATGVDKALMPALVATSNGVDLAYYGAGAGTQLYNLFFVQSLANDNQWSTPEAVIGVHSGEPCQDGIACTSGRQLYDDFGLDVDSQGWAHITFSHDGPAKPTGDASSETGYAVQTAGHAVGTHG